ncbi:DUF4405 domain-containing protein [Treponema putidum]|nr:DUF4405 domain-containing protein [Treponema putidum]
MAEQKRTAKKMTINKLRMPLDIVMTLLSIILMGGAYLFPADIVHEIIGAALFVLWAVHITLNRKWYGSMFHGKYNSLRIMQTIINCGIFVCVIFLMISGIILSNHIFTFLGIEIGLGFARIVHLLASHWYFMFMSFHIGLHAGMIAKKIAGSSRTMTNAGRAKILVCRIMLALLCIYGLHAFITRGVWRYLILQQQFFFLNLEKGYILFFVDYFAILSLLAAITHFIGKIIKKK